MNEAEDIVGLFKLADELIVNYLVKVESLQKHIHDRIERNVPLPPAAVVALHSGVENDVVWLHGAVGDLDDSQRKIAAHLARIRAKLSIKEHNYQTVADAKNLVTGWANNTDRLLDSVINQYYQHSNLLPPPAVYWKPINDRFYDYFPFLSSDPRWQKKMGNVANYLRSVDNPWAKYRKP
jgi:hypothetical protein